MNLIKPLAATLLAALSINVAMATTGPSPWCGYDSTATISTTHYGLNDIPAMVAALNNAAQKCGHSSTAGNSSKLSAQLSTWATACTAKVSGIIAIDVEAKQCATNYGNLIQQNPAFLSGYTYPADFQSTDVKMGPFCDNGTNPANKTNYTNDPLCQCIGAFGYVNQSHPGTTANMIGHTPYSWLTSSDKDTYKAQAKTQLAHSSNYATGGTPTSQTAAQCCVLVGGTVNGNKCQ
ncbi:MAG: hypothetical protein ACHQAX_00320 [Gammaproteobacteria bacterium]